MARAWRDMDTGGTLMLGVDQHHRYLMMSPECRFVDPHMNVEGRMGVEGGGVRTRPFPATTGPGRKVDGRAVMALTNSRLYDGCSPCGNSCVTGRSDPELMDRTSVRRTVTGDVACESCGRLPHPRQRRLRSARLAVRLPIELLLLVLVIAGGLPLIAAVALLAFTMTIPVIYVVRPSLMRSLGWSNASFRGVRNDLGVCAGPPIAALALVHSSTAALALRVSVSDSPGARLSEIREVAEPGSRQGLSEAAFQPGTGPRSSWH